MCKPVNSLDENSVKHNSAIINQSDIQIVVVGSMTIWIPTYEYHTPHQDQSICHKTDNLFNWWNQHKSQFGNYFNSINRKDSDYIKRFLHHNWKPN